MVRTKPHGRKPKAARDSGLAIKQQQQQQRQQRELPQSQETARQAAELAAMQRMLELSEGRFSLSIAVCNSPALRDYLIDRLRESRPGIKVIGLPSDLTDVLGYIEANLHTVPSALMVAALDKSIPSSEANHPVLQSLNAAREQLEKRCPWPVVIWLPEYAPDSYRFTRLTSGGIAATVSSSYLIWLAPQPVRGTVFLAISA